MSRLRKDILALCLALNLALYPNLLWAAQASSTPQEATCSHHAASGGDSLPETIDEPKQAPNKIGPYIPLAILGEGGMGTVYLAKHEKTGAQVALKVARIENMPALAHRWKREVEAVTRLKHDNIVPITDSFTIGEDLYIMAMPVVRGHDGGYICAHTSEGLSPSQSVSIVLQIARALEYSHNAGIVHRDIKPGNIIVESEAKKALLLDFGLAMVEGATVLTVQGQIMGTPNYMSPEQADGQTVDLRTDVYSLGATLYSFITGNKPFDGNKLQVLENIKTKPFPRLMGKEASLNPIIQKMTARSPDNRYQNMAEVIRALLAWQSTEGSPVTRLVPETIGPIPTPKPIKRQFWTTRRRLLGFGFSALVASIVTGILLQPGDAPYQRSPAPRRFNKRQRCEEVKLGMWLAQDDHCACLLPDGKTLIYIDLSSDILCPEAVSNHMKSKR